MKAARSFLALCGISLVGCAAHTQLGELPGGSEPIETRMGAYQRYRPVSEQQTLHVTINQYGNVSNATLTLDHITLADGSVIIYPEDLLPAVESNSPTAQAAIRSREARRIGMWLNYPGLLASIAGVGIMIPGVFAAVPHTTYNSDGTTTTQPGNYALLGTSIGVLAAGLVLLAVGGFGFNGPSARDRLTTFETYPTALASRLGLCDQGDGRLTDCNQPRSAPSRVVPTTVDAHQKPPESDRARRVGRFAGNVTRHRAGGTLCATAR